MTVHALRHSYASWLLDEGVDIRTIADLLGHSDFRITGQLYTHVSERLKVDAMQRIQGRFDE